MQESSGDREGSEQEKVAAKIKISGPEQIFAFLIDFINLITGLQRMRNVLEYAEAIRKVEAASGFPMSKMIYLTCSVDIVDIVTL